MRIKLAPLAWLLAVALGLAGCASQPATEEKKAPPSKKSSSIPHRLPVKAKPIPTPQPLTGAELVDSLLPASLQDKAGWAADIVAAFEALHIPQTPENVCAVLAEIAQESSFQARPVVPGLPNIVRRELEVRRDRYGIPQWLMDKSLELQSPDGRTYNERIDVLRTENDVNDLYDDMISEIPLGKKFLADYNPVRTAGPMQINADFANTYAARYPYPYNGSLRNALFTRKGGLYFGVAYLLDYPANYSSMNFRFADYNAGRYSSRNTAFQNAVSALSGVRLRPDGDLLRYRNGVAQQEPSQTMQALLAIAPRLGMDQDTIFRDLLLEKSAAFERSRLYARVYALAPDMPRASLPDIAVNSIKFSRQLNTVSYAKRVEARYLRCLKKAGSD